MAERSYTAAYTHYTADVSSMKGRGCSWLIEGPADGLVLDRPLVTASGSTTQIGGSRLCPPKYGVEHGARPVRTLLELAQAYGQFVAVHNQITVNTSPLERVDPCAATALRIAGYGAEQSRGTDDRLAMAGITHEEMVRRYAEQAVAAQTEQLVSAEQPA